jgi:hypothetical protein
MSWEIVSKKSGKIQIVSDEERDKMIELGLDKIFNWSEIKERKLKEVPLIPPEVKTKTKKVNG